MSRLLVATIILAGLGCNTDQPASITQAQRQLVVDSVTAAMGAYAAAFPGKDPEAITRFYADDPDFRYYDGGQATAYPAMVAMIRSLTGSLRSIEGGFDSIQVSVLSPSAGVATARFRDVLTDTSGTVTRVHGVVSWVWVRRGDGWRIMHGNAVHLPDSSAR